MLSNFLTRTSFLENGHCGYKLYYISTSVFFELVSKQLNAGAPSHFKIFNSFLLKSFVLILKFNLKWTDHGADEFRLSRSISSGAFGYATCILWIPESSARNTTSIPFNNGWRCSAFTRNDSNGTITSGRRIKYDAKRCWKSRVFAGIPHWIVSPTG